MRRLRALLMGLLLAAALTGAPVSAAEVRGETTARRAGEGMLAVVGLGLLGAGALTGLIVWGEKT